MKIMTAIAIAVAVLATAPAVHAFDGKEDLTAAAKKLADAANYSWTSSSKNNADTGGQAARFAPGAVEGKAEKGGLMFISMKMGDRTMEVAVKGEKFAMKTPDGWKGSADAAAPQEGQRPDPAMFMSRFIKNVKSPADGVLQIIDRLKEIKSEGDGLYSGEFTEQGAKDTLVPPRADGQAGQAGPTVSDAKGSVKIWVKDGLISKIESTLTGKMKVRDQERAVDRTTTIEIKDVGATKLEIPDEAKKKLE